MVTRQPGIIVTQAGVSAPYAADYQMVFNSNWPSLQIAFDTTVSVPAGGSLSLPHDLKIYPLTMAWVVQNGVSKGRLFATSENFEDPTQTAITLSFDNINVILFNNDLSNAYTINVKCFNVDISKSVDYTLPKPALVKTPYDPTFGIKVVKYGLSIGSTDLRNFILHSRAQSPAVLSVVTNPSTTTKVSSPAIQYTNPAGYVPWVLAFINGPGSGQPYTALAPGGQQTGYIHVLSNTSYIANSIGTPYGSLVVLRDPLVVPNTVTVTY